MLDLITINALVPLMKRKAKVQFFGEKHEVGVKALFDGGAVCSFIQFTCLDEKTRVKINEYLGSNGGDGANPLGISKELVTIKGATGAVTETCAVAKVKVKIGDWSGEQSFIISKNLGDKELILGRDFLKANQVVVDHGRDRITIRIPIKFNNSISKRQSVEVNGVVLEDTVIKQKSEQSVRVHIALSKVGEEVLFTSKANEGGLYWSNSLCKVDGDGNVVVSVINLSPESVVAKAGTYVGYASSDYEVVPMSTTVEAKTLGVNQKLSTEPPSQNEVKEKLDRLKIGSGLSGDQKDRLQKLLSMKLAAFQWSPEDVGRTHLMKHKIDTADARPTKMKQFKTPQAVQGIMDDTIDDLRKQKLIEPSISPWCSPVMIVKQTTRDGKTKYRFISDNRALNNVTVKDSFPLNRMDAAFDCLNGAMYFTVVDMARGYYQVELDEEAKEKTAFSANGKLWQWTVMTLGLCNAPSTYTRLMDLVLHGLTYKYCLVYLDDTIIYSRSFDEHLEHVGEVLDRIIQANLKLRPEKCVFAAAKVNYLGYVISKDGVKPDGDKVKIIDEMPFPKSAKSMIRFLGTVNFYRDFIMRFSNTASVLYKMSQSESKFKAKKDSPKAAEAFEKLKACLMAEPILRYPDFTKPFVVQTDASGIAIGAVIGQHRVVNGRKVFFPIMYGSRHLTLAESRWSATERELLAITWANKKFAAYVFGRHVTYVTDHEPLVTLRELKEPAGRLGCGLHVGISAGCAQLHSGHVIKTRSVG